MTLDVLASAARVRARLEAHRDAFELTWKQPKPVTAAALSAVEKKLGMKLPVALRAFYMRGAGGLILAWNARRGHEERLGGDLHSPVGGMLELVTPEKLGRRLASHGVVQLTSDGGGNGYALAKGDERGTVLWFDHDPVDGVHVQPAGLGRFDAWFTAWAKIGFGSFREDTDRVAAFLRSGKLAPLADDLPAPRPRPSKAHERGPVVEAPKHKEHVWAVAVLRDGLRGASGSNDGTVHVFDLASGARVAKLAAQDYVYGLIAHPTRDLLVAGTKSGFEVWNTKTGKATRATQPHAGRVLDMALSKDGERLVTIGRGELATWDLSTGKRVASMEDDGSSVRIDSRGRAVTYDERKVRVWNLGTKKCEVTIAHAKMPIAMASRSLVVDAGTDTVIVVERTGRLARWTTKGKCLVAPKSTEHALPNATLTPDGRTLLMNGTEVGVTIEARDVESGKRTKTLSLRDRVGVIAIAVTPDGRRAVLGSAYGWVVVCELDAMVPAP